jgi:hypothetical protein
MRSALRRNRLIFYASTDQTFSKQNFINFIKQTSIIAVHPLNIERFFKEKHMYFNFFYDI